MDRQTRLGCLCSAAFCPVLHTSPPPPPSGCEPLPTLSWGEALILVVLSSLGLWALIWGLISLMVA
jgi:hypothetical protein